MGSKFQWHLTGKQSGLLYRVIGNKGFVTETNNAIYCKRFINVLNYVQKLQCCTDFHILLSSFTSGRGIGNKKVRRSVHCKKELAVFPSPAGMSLIKLFLGGNNLGFSRPERVWSVTSRLGTGKWLTLFYSVEYKYLKEAPSFFCCLTGPPRL